MMEVKESTDIEVLLGKFDPEIFIPLGDKAVIEPKLNDANLTNINSTNKVKAGMDKFGKDDFILEAVLFN